MAQVITPGWIELDGAANVRDVGGLPRNDGTTVAARRLIRSDNLQGLSARDVRALIDDYDVAMIVDLRSDIEVASEGPTRFGAEPLVGYLHASLFLSYDAIAVPDTEDGPVVLPWQNRAAGDRRGAAQVYLGYLAERPDSVLAAVRAIAHADGAVIVHCAAGKDRTGIVVALALDAVGVTRQAIVDDYARTGERMTPLLARLAASPTYAHDVEPDYPDRHRPRPSTMVDFFAMLDERHGGTLAWLTSQGWTDADQRALTAKLTAG